MAYESLPVFKGPQCLIESSKDGKLKVVEDVLTHISHIKDKLNVVAITGLYRTGKSYLLNRLANTNKASTINAATTESTTDSKSIVRPSVASTNETSTTLVPTSTSSTETSSSPTGTSTQSTETSTATAVTVSNTFTDVATALTPSTATEVTTSTLASSSEISTTSVASTSSAVATSTRQTTISSASTGTPQTSITTAMSTTLATTSIPSQTLASTSSTGFPLGDTVESKTKGIWAWCRPHPTRKNEVLLLLDTEGLGDIMKGDGNHDNWIFTLATLLADTLVYNAKGTFDQDALEKLRFITEMSKHVTTSAKKKKDDNLDLYFPRFILTLRDFTLQLKKDGKEITSDEYLEDCLSLRAGADQSAIKYNTPRKCIRKYFKRRKCFTFEMPGGRKVLSQLETLGDEALTEEFVEDSNKFTTYVLDKCDSKSLRSGQPVNGRMFATLTQTYVTAIRDGKIPCIESALESMAQSENSKAVEACVQLYLERMNIIVQFPVLNENGLSEAHQDCLQKAIILFLEKAVYDQDHKYQIEANEKMNVEYENFKKKNERESEVRCQGALAQLNKTIETKIGNNEYSRPGGYGLYQKDILGIQIKYNEKSDLGCKKEEMILKYLANKWIEGQTILQADRKVSETERKAEIERQRAIEAEKQRKHAEVLAEKQMKKYEDEARQMKENLEQLILKQEQEMQNQLKKQEEAIKKRLEEQERLLKEGFEEESEKMREGIASLEEEKKEMENQATELRNNSTKKGGGCVLL